MPNILSLVFGVAPDSERAFHAAWAICKVLGAENKDMLGAIVTYFEYFSSYVSLMKWVISKEIDGMGVSEGSVPFREDTISTALLLEFGLNSQECLSYLNLVTKPSILKIKALSAKHAECTEEVQSNELLTICGNLVTTMVQNCACIPTSYLEICQHISARVNARFPNTGMDVVGIAGVFLLRFVYRSLSFPEEYSIVKKGKVNPFLRRYLVKVTKVLQRLSSIEDESSFESGIANTANSEAWATFMRANRIKIREFLHDIRHYPTQQQQQHPTGGSATPRKWIENGSFRSACKTINSLITKNEAELCRLVPGLVPIARSKRSNSSGDVDVDTLETLNSCLSNPLSLEAFKKFTQLDFSEEPLLFVIEVEKFMHNPTVDHAKHIFDKYIKSGAEYEVGTEQKMRNNVNETIMSGTVDRSLFQKIHSLIYASIADDSYPRFKQRVLSQKGLWSK